jgi:small subunit ribosomal protein S17
MTDDSQDNTPEDETPVAAPEGAAEQAASEESAPETALAADAAPEEEAGADVAASEDAADDGPAAEEGEPAERLSPKERRRRARSTHSPEKARPRRSPEERYAERLAERRAKALRRRARRSQERAKRAATRAREGAAVDVAAPAKAAESEGARKVRQGVVVSDKADKTITVRIDTARRHRRYEKIVRSSTTLHAHDEANDANEGDVVRVIESRPLSRSKRWRLVDVVERAR